jgi:hypothetical protein
MKKIICLVLTVILLFTSITPAVADNSLQQVVNTIESKLTDLFTNGIAHWAKPYIDRLIEKEIIVGYPDDTFKPNNNVEVDSYIKMVVCALGNNFENGNDNWASPFINKAIELKLIDNNEFNTYRRSITREEAAKVIVQALAATEELPSVEQINKYISKVPDYTNVVDKYKQHALTAYATGMITGDPKGNFNPKDNLTRAEAATVIMRLLDKSLRKPIPAEDESSSTLPELLKSDAEVWGREDISHLTLPTAYTIRDEKIYFNEPPIYNEYELENNINPDISEQIYRVTKTLIDDNHYVYTNYLYDDRARAGIGFSKSIDFAFNSSYFFQYLFYEKAYNNVKEGWSTSSFSEKSYITLNLYSLWWNDDPDWSTPYYETKLKHSLMAIFGEVEGKDIYTYVFSMYLDKRNNPDKYTNKRLTKSFRTVKVDFGNDESAELCFYFSKVGDN